MGDRYPVAIAFLFEVDAIAGKFIAIIGIAAARQSQGQRYQQGYPNVCPLPVVVLGNDCHCHLPWNWIGPLHPSSRDKCR
jgi:hypothetical protein